MNPDPNNPTGDMPKQEQWLPVEGFETRYVVSDLGRIINIRSSQILKYNLLPKGYSLVSLWNGSKAKSFKVARIVARAFHPNTGGLREVNHINGIKDDDRAANLEWVSSSQNQQHAWDTGLRSRVRSYSYGGKLNAAQASEIKTLILTGATRNEIAGRFGVSKATISNIKNGKAWINV